MTWTALSYPTGIFSIPKKYLQKGIVLNVRTKRGCPFKCIYCTTPQIEGNRDESYDAPEELSMSWKY